jgi:hypothetical protein
MDDLKIQEEEYLTLLSESEHSCWQVCYSDKQTDEGKSSTEVALESCDY